MLKFLFASVAGNGAPAPPLDACTPNNNGAVTARRGKTPAQRRTLYFAACLPARLTLAILIMVAGVYMPRSTAVAAVLLGFAITVVNIVLQKRRGCRWWYPGGNAALGAAAVLVGVLVLTHRAPAVLIGALMVAQVVAGLALALQLQPWSARATPS